MSINLQSEPLFSMRFSLLPAASVTVAGNKRGLGPIAGGTFSGPRLSGSVLPGGGDWYLSRADDVTEADIRLMLSTDDGEIIAMSYSGLIQGMSHIEAALAQGRCPDPADYRIRQVARFQAAGVNTWLNSVMAVGLGQMVIDPVGVEYSFYELR